MFTEHHTKTYWRTLGTRQTNISFFALHTVGSLQNHYKPAFINSFNLISNKTRNYNTYLQIITIFKKNNTAHILNFFFKFWCYCINNWIIWNFWQVFKTQLLSPISYVCPNCAICCKRGTDLISMPTNLSFPRAIFCLTLSGMESSGNLHLLLD